MPDFTPVTELPGSLLNAQQRARMVQRYALAAQLAKGQRVLEVACGAGIGLGIVQQSATQLVGCDLTYRVLAVAQGHYGARLPLAGADAQSLPFAAASFDLLLSFEAVYYLPDLDAFLNEARRVLAATGKLLIGTSNPDWPHFVPGALSVYYPNIPELTARLQQTGFGQIQAWGSLPDNPTLSARQRLIAKLRQRIGRLPLFTADNGLTRLLKRLAYGALTPLPAELPPVTEIDPQLGLTPIDPTKPDDHHRVIFILAQA